MKYFSLILIVSFLALTGCASLGRAWKGLVSSDDGEKKAENAPNANGANGANANNAPSDANSPSFNTNPNFGNYQDRQYKRVTKQSFAENQQLEETSGSLWKREGQGSYLFAQNNLRLMGDVINVDVDGRVSENLNSKVAGLKKSQSKFDFQPRPQALPRVSRVPRPEGEDERGIAGANGQPNQAPPPAPVAKTQTPPAVEPPKTDDKKENMKFDPVTCRIVEKNQDGSYRIKGSQLLVIGRKEYKLIVSGVVRADDINTDTIAASKIIESKFDLVATNRDVNP